MPGFKHTGSSFGDLRGENKSYHAAAATVIDWEKVDPADATHAERNKAINAQVEVLKAQISTTRDVAGGGNCYYYAAMFSYLEAILIKGQPADLERLELLKQKYRADYKNIKDKIQDIPFADLCSPAAFDAFIDQIKEPADKKTQLELLTKAFNFQSKPNFALSIASYLRYATYHHNLDKLGTTSDSDLDQHLVNGHRADERFTASVPTVLDACIYVGDVDIQTGKVEATTKLAGENSRKLVPVGRPDEDDAYFAILHTHNHFHAARLASLAGDYPAGVDEANEGIPTPASFAPGTSQAQYDAAKITGNSGEFPKVKAALKQDAEAFVKLTHIDEVQFTSACKKLLGEDCTVSQNDSSWVAESKDQTKSVTHEGVGANSKITVKMANTSLEDLINETAKAIAAEFEASGYDKASITLFELGPPIPQDKTSKDYAKHFNERNKLWETAFKKAGFAKVVLPRPPVSAHQVFKPCGSEAPKPAAPLIQPRQSAK